MIAVETARETSINMSSGWIFQLLHRLGARAAILWLLVGAQLSRWRDFKSWPAIGPFGNEQHTCPF